MFKPGDYVLHSRQGPGRIVEVLPDHLSIRTRGGNVYKVNVGIAEQELAPVPSDGFVALLAEHDFSAERLLQQIPEIVERIMRDKRRTSLSKKELRAELAPFLVREEKSFTPWWKLAQQRMLSSGRIVADPKKKNHLALAARSSQSTISNNSADRVVDPMGAIGLAREIASSNDPQSAAQIAVVLFQRIVQLSSQYKDARSSLTLLLASAYLLDLQDETVKSKVVAYLRQENAHTFPISRELDDDIVLALPKLAKAANDKAVKIAEGLLEHPSLPVAKKAFAVLNTDKHRNSLKSRLFSWLEAPDKPLAHFELFLSEDFLAVLRREDKGRLYRVLSRGRFDDKSVRQFLSRGEYATFAAEGLKESESLDLMGSRQLSSEARAALLRSLRPEEQVQSLLDKFSPELDAALAECVKQLEWTVLAPHAQGLKNVLQLPSSVQTTSVIVAKCKEFLEAASDGVLLEVIAFSCGILSCVHASETSGALKHAIHTGTRRLLQEESTPAIRPFMAAITTLIVEGKIELTQESERSAAAAEEANNRANVAEQEVKRLQNIVEMVKSASGQDRQQTRLQGKVEIINVMLPIIDELERRAASSQTDRDVLNDLKIALHRAGMEQIGATGRTLELNTQYQEFLSEPQQPSGSVQVVRTGYVLRDNGSEIVIRRALVRPAEYEVPR